MGTPVGESQAYKFNKMVMRQLQKALEADPEVDLASRIPSSYSSRLASRKAEEPPDPKPPSQFPEDDVRHWLEGLTAATILFPLSESVQSYLEGVDNNISLSHSLLRLVEHSEVIWKPKFGRHKIVVKCGPDIALKIIQDMEDSTEYTILQYLEKYVPGIPAPRPLGLVRIGQCFLFFMSLMPGKTLEAVWDKLDDPLKSLVQEQLNGMFVELRSLTRPDNMPLGGVAGEGCKDLRRHVRHTKEPMWTTQEFDDWQFSNPHFGSKIYIETLRRLSPRLSQKHVLSHNDLRPDNIIVKVEDGQCHVTGIIDWQYGGFYPEYYESTKVMNSITPNEVSDWYLFIPECISPLQIHAPRQPRTKWKPLGLWHSGPDICGFRI